MCNVIIREPVMVVDIGNTNILCAIYLDGEPIWTARFTSSREKTSDEYYILLSGLMESSVLSEEEKIAIEDINYVALGSVVPELTRVWRHLFSKYFKVEITEINALSPLGISFRVENPSFIGADLIANAYAALHKYKSSSIIIDLGTATTIELISNERRFEGAIIAPGMKLGAEILFQRAAQLYEIELVQPPVLLGLNTTDAMLSGVVYGHSIMLDVLVVKIKEQYSQLAPIRTILTGGMASLVKPSMKEIDVVDRHLTLDGFYLAFCRILQQK